MDKPFLMIFNDEGDLFQGLVLAEVELFFAFVDGFDKRMVIDEIFQLSSVLQL